MAYFHDLGTITVLTAADLSASKFRIMKGGSADRTVAAATDATAAMIGVTTDQVADGSTTPAGVSMQIAGIAKVEAGGTVTRWTAQKAGAGGKCENGTSGDNIIGYAMESGTADGIIPVLLTPGVKLP
jgi:hypothetical protein